MSKRFVLFILAVMFQITILAVIPAGKMNAVVRGSEIVLKINPVDPYDFLSGYHVVLNYEISSPDQIEDIDFDDVVFVVLRPDSEGTYCAKEVRLEYPDDLDHKSVVIKGIKKRGRIVYGIEKFHIPEADRDDINSKLAQEGAKAVVKVAPNGTAVILRIIPKQLE